MVAWAKIHTIVRKQHRVIINPIITTQMCQFSSVQCTREKGLRSPYFLEEILIFINYESVLYLRLAVSMKWNSKKISVFKKLTDVIPC